MRPKKPAVDASYHDIPDLNKRDEAYMRLALEQAHLSENIGEVPVGAIVVDKTGKIIAKGTNLREKENSVLGHAELLAIHRASKKVASWRLLDCTLYVTLEPCYMCSGALVQSRIKRVVFGAHDPKGGALETLSQLGNDPRLNHRFDVKGGVLAEECSQVLKNFFKKKRNVFS